MMGFIRAFEATAMSAGIAAMNSGDGRTRVIHHTSRRSIDRLIAALRVERQEVAALRAENARLRKALQEADDVARLMASSRRSHAA